MWDFLDLLYTPAKLFIIKDNSSRLIIQKGPLQASGHQTVQGD
jgi:hypothetical protein